MRSAWLGVFLVVAGLPAAASACPNCLAATDNNVQWAFLVASLGLTALPLSLIGGTVWWLRRRANRFADLEAAGVIRLPTSPARPRSGS